MTDKHDQEISGLETKMDTLVASFGEFRIDDAAWKSNVDTRLKSVEDNLKRQEDDQRGTAWAVAGADVQVRGMMRVGLVTGALGLLTGLVSLVGYLGQVWHWWGG